MTPGRIVHQAQFSITMFSNTTCICTWDGLEEENTPVVYLHILLSLDEEKKNRITKKNFNIKKWEVWMRGWWFELIVYSTFVWRYVWGRVVNTVFVSCKVKKEKWQNSLLRFPFYKCNLCPLFIPPSTPFRVVYLNSVCNFRCAFHASTYNISSKLKPSTSVSGWWNGIRAHLTSWILI